MELENVGDQPTKKGPINGGNVGIASDDTSPCLASDKTIKEESKNPSCHGTNNNLSHSSLSHIRIYQRLHAEVNQSISKSVMASVSLHIIE